MNLDPQVLETIGWIGSTLLAFCAVPEAIRSLIRKDCEITWYLLVPWTLGEYFAIIYGWFALKSFPLLVNYAVNITCLMIMIYYKVKTQRRLRSEQTAKESGNTRPL